MTTIRQLLEQTPMRIDSGIELLCNYSYSHIPEMRDEEFSDVIYVKEFAPDIKTHVFYDQYWDVRRGQSLCGVKFRDTWVMITYNAGRHGRDHCRRQILDTATYREMVAYLKSECAKHFASEEMEETSLDTEVNFTFYGHDVRYPNRDF